MHGIATPSPNAAQLLMLVEERQMVAAKKSSAPLLKLGIFPYGRPVVSE